MKRLLVSLTLLSALVVGPAVLPTVAGAATPAGGSCAVTWGSMSKSRGPGTTPFSLVHNVRTGRHECYDRFVVDLTGSARGYGVRYVRRFRLDPSDEIVPLPGGARIEIVIRAPAVDLAGHASYPGVVGEPLPGVNLTGYETFRSTVYGGTFEGYTQFGLGVRARLPFRVTKLSHRVVIDVAHHW